MSQRRRARPVRAVGQVTLADLAERRGITADSLRQRVNRGTLQAEKVGPVWTVTPATAAKVMAEIGQSWP